MSYIKNLLAAGLILAVAIAASAQSPRNLDYGINFGQNGKVISARDDGYVFVAGTFEGTQDFGSFTLTSNGNADIYVLQIDATGAVINAISFGSVDGSEDVADIHVDNADGNIHVVGSFTGLVDFDPGPSDVSMDAGFSVYGYILTLDLDLGFERVGTIISDGWSYVNSVATDDNGDVYLTGYFENSADLDPTIGELIVDSPGQSAFFIKTNVAGTLQWVKTIGNDVQVIGTGATVDFAGNPIFTGTYLSSVDINPDAGTQTLTGVGNSDVFILKLAASDGAFTWGKSIGGDGGNNYTDAIASDGQNNIYLTGQFYGSGDFDPGAGTKILTTNGGDADIFVTKFNQAGALVWARSFGSISYESAEAISVSGSDLYLTGEYYDAIDFGTSSAHILEPNQSGDAYFLNLDTSGNFKWVEAIAGTNYDVGHDVVTDAAGVIYTMGRFDSYDIDLDPSCNTLTLNPDDGYSYLLRIGNGAADCLTITQQPVGADVCPGTTVVLEVKANGTGIIYQWMYYDIDGGWQDVVDAAGVFSGAQTSKLTITTNSSYQGEGDYVVVLTKAPSQEVMSDIAEVTVGPHAPYVVDENVVLCGAGSATIKVYNGDPGQYRWYTQETGGSPIAGATNDTYVTPILTVTTSYYVSINNGSCESDRTKVTVWITACEPQPGLKWAKGFGGTGTDGAGEMIMLKDGNILIAGAFSASIDVDPGPGVTTLTTTDGFQDGFLLKITPDAELIWVKQFVGANSSVGPSFLEEDADGNIYLTGTITGFDTDFDPGTGTFNIDGQRGVNNFPDAFIAKYDKDGNFLWGRKFGNDAYFDGITGLEVDANAVYMSGYFWYTLEFDEATNLATSAGGTDFYVTKLTPAGGVTWFKQFGNSYANGNVQTDVNSVLYLHGNDLYVGGVVRNAPLDLDPNAGVHEISPTFDNDAYVLKLNTDGEFQSVFKYENTADGSSTMQDIIVDNSGNLYTSGSFTGTADFDPTSGVFTHTSTGGISGDPALNGYINKHTSTGALTWSKALHVSFLNDAHGGDMTIAANGDLIISGNYQGSVDFDPGPLEYILSGNNLFLNSFLLKLNSNGEFNWVVTLARVANVSSSASGGDHFVDANGDIYMQGSLSGSVDFDPLDCQYEVKAVGATDFYLWKLSFGSANICFQTLPADQIVCSGGIVSLEAVAVGAPGITYQWQRSDTEGGTYTNINDGGGYSGTTLSKLQIDSKAGFGEGFYRVIASAPNAADKTSTEAEVQYTGITPDPPTTIGAASCEVSADLTLTASGGSTDNYRWYTEAVGGTPDYYQNDEVFQTGTLTSSFTYYVAITDGVCESTRTPVTATINAASSPPVTFGSERCDPGTVELTASGAQEGEYRWYTTATGGAISGETSSTYTTPSLTATTTYYVGITLPDCESPRAEVVATINEPTPPIVGGKGACLNTSVQLTAPTSDGEIRWYSVSTGGSPISVGETYTTPLLSVTTTYYVSEMIGTCESTRTAVTVTVGDCTNNQSPVINTTTASVAVGGIATIDLGLTDPDNNLDLTTLKIITQPTSGAVATISNGQLVIDYTGSSFAGEDEVTIEVCDIAGSCVQQVIHITVASDMVVYNAVSPNGDGKNDVFFLAYIDAFEETRSNTVKIYNRWGDLVFEVDDYNNTTNVFAGKNKSGNDLPSGTYYYKIEFRDGRKTEAGYLSLKR